MRSRQIRSFFAGFRAENKKYPVFGSPQVGVFHSLPGAAPQRWSVAVAGASCNHRPVANHVWLKLIHTIYIHPLCISTILESLPDVKKLYLKNKTHMPLVKIEQYSSIPSHDF